MRIIFVCTGNTCRSPMAEALLKEALAARGWSADDVAGVLGGNWLRVLGRLYA